MADKITKQQAIQNIISSDKVFLTPAEVAPILGVDPHSIRIIARQKPHLLKFEFMVSGNRTKIPRIPFLRYIGVDVDSLGESQNTQKENNVFEKKPLTNEELLSAITLQINEFKKEINERLDKIENETHDLNNVLQSARNFINALSGYATDN